MRQVSCGRVKFGRLNLADYIQETLSYIFPHIFELPFPFFSTLLHIMARPTTMKVVDIVLL